MAAVNENLFHAAFFVETIARPARDPRTRGLRRRTDGRVRAVAPLGLCTWPPGPTGRTPLSAHRPGWSSLFCCQAVGIADVAVLWLKQSPVHPPDGQLSAAR